MGDMTAWVLALFASDSIDIALFVTAFVSATLFPGGSEVMLAGALAAQPERWAWLFAVATAGNTLGSMTSWVIGRFIPTVKRETKAVLWVRRWGAWALLFAWLPVVGDAIPVAAGWLRIDPLMSLLAIAVGKGIRYACVAGAVLPLVL